MPTEELSSFLFIHPIGIKVMFIRKFTGLVLMFSTVEKVGKVAFGALARIQAKGLRKGRQVHRQKAETVLEGDIPTLKGQDLLSHPDGTGNFHPTL